MSYDFGTVAAAKSYARALNELGQTNTPEYQAAQDYVKENSKKEEPKKTGNLYVKNYR